MSWLFKGAVLGLGVALAGCQYAATPDPVLSSRDTEFMGLIPKYEVDRSFERYQIDDPTGEAPGTVVVDTKDKFLYFVQPGGKAIRYGVATGTRPMAGPAPLRCAARRNGRAGCRRPT